MQVRHFIIGVAVAAIMFIVILNAPKSIHEIEYTAPDVIETVVVKKEEPVTLLFVGDIMLGRNVETLMGEYGLQYPFQNVVSLLNDPDLTIGNFEGIVSEKHIHTPSMTFQFSIQKEHLKQLQETGFDILSLANNHSNDYGKSALRYTRALCADYMILCAGTSLDFDEYSLLIKKVGGKKVGFVFVYAVYVSPDPIRLAEMLDALTVETDMQIAYIHWGDEYMLSHSASQESLAQMMIDNGVDAVIGHHPHVVQDIALYKNKPIFYSLGNFIFDQYFSTDVQEGLGVTLAITDAESTYSLIPFTSVGTHAQPRVMEEEKHRLFNRILNDIQSVDGVDIENGSLTIPNRN